MYLEKLADESFTQLWVAIVADAEGAGLRSRYIVEATFIGAPMLIFASNSTFCVYYKYQQAYLLLRACSKAKKSRD